MKPRLLKSFLIIVIIIALIYCGGTILYSRRFAISREKFVSYMTNNGYYVASEIVFNSGDDHKKENLSGDDFEEHEFVMAVTAYIDELDIRIDFYEYSSVQMAEREFVNYCTDIKNAYFYKSNNHELTILADKSHYIQESYGTNFSRYIIKDPDKSVTSMVSRIDNTLILIRDCRNTSFYKIKDSLGNIGY